MIVYLDVLIVVNLIVDYFLLLLTAKFNNKEYKNFRLILSSLIGSIFSLYIFFENSNIILDLLIRVLGSAVMIIVGFGVKSLKGFLRDLVTLFAASFIYCGIMFACWFVFKWNTIIINNSVVYLDISPQILIILSVVIYLIIKVLKSILKRNAVSASRAEVTLEFMSKKRCFSAIFDTGNSVKDLLSNSEVIFISQKKGEEFLGGKPNEFPKNYRILPCGTVTGSKLLEGVRIDLAQINLNQTKICLTRPILALCEINLDSEFDIILNPEILKKSEETSYASKN